MDLTNEEKEYLRSLVKEQLKRFKEEEKTIIEEEKPAFLASEAKYEDFLKGLLKKI